MAQSLVNITKSIRDGTIRYAHWLPLNLREGVLDTAIKQGLADNPNILALLTSVEFLSGMTSLTVEVRSEDDLKFLKRLGKSLAAKLPNGQTVGAGMTKLNLKVRGSTFGNENARSDLSAASDLIVKCPNTSSLDLRVAGSNSTKEFWPLKNLDNSCSRVMGNLVELSLSNFNYLTMSDTIVQRPIVNFKQLTTLKLLNRCFIEDDQWPEVFKNIQSVENLHFVDVHNWKPTNKRLDWILPSPLPHLKWLEVDGDISVLFVCNKAFVDNLMECPKLRQVHLKLDQKSTDQESLVRLAEMDIDLKMKIRIAVRGNDPAENAAVLDSSSRFKLVTIFRDWMDSFELSVWDEWDPQYSTALEDLLTTCPNLTTFGMKQPRFNVSKPQSEEERKRVNAALVQFFGDVERAQQLNRLLLIGKFDETVLSAVFGSCVNLTRLEMIFCSTLRDQNLINWVSLGGGKLTDLVMIDCLNITSEGIVPVLIKSADGLLRHLICMREGDWVKVLSDLCPNTNIDRSAIALMEL